ncbi:hypothetical protein ERJ75_000882200 [Trypanosoma vivax]|nr:hypothetical protein TRVL_02460 [Trypanosoma vivax]KAH8612585.1 hypothetical protein ERJ75_000882200 [Trypanosoma vivax]
MPPDKATEALQLFASLRGSLAVDEQSGSIIATARAFSEGRSASTGREETGATQLGDRDVCRQLELADRVARRLYAKNQQLLQRIAELEAGASSARPEGHRPGNVRCSGVAAKRGGVPRAHEDKSREHCSSNDVLSLQLVLLRVRKLEAQYRQMLDSKVERDKDMEDENADMKLTVMRLKAKMVAAACKNEAEVLLLNERLLATERQLMVAAACDSSSTTPPPK